MILFNQIIEFTKTLFISKRFWIGFGICFAVFSHYIFGRDNLLEQIGEKFTENVLHNFLGVNVDVDFSSKGFVVDKKSCEVPSE